MGHRNDIGSSPNAQPRPPHVEDLQRAVSLHQRGDLSGAKEIYDRILSDNPHHFDALHLSGVLALKLGKYDEAETYFAEATQINPQFFALQFNRGIALQNLKRFNEALASYDAALSIKPEHAEAYVHRGIVLEALDRFDEALNSYDAAISIKPDHAEAFCHRGILHEELQRFDLALASYDAAISIRPDFAAAFCHRGNALEELRRFDEAFACYDKAISIQSNHADAYWSKAVLHLLLGNFSEGLTLFEWRKLRTTRSGSRSYAKPLWLGQDSVFGKMTLFHQDQGLWLSDDSVMGKTLLIHHEQGLGDTIHFCRYILPLVQTGAKILFAPHKQLKSLVASLPADVELVDADDPDLQFDYHCPLMSLPLAFKTDLATIPNATPYLSADPALISKWKQHLGEAGYKIGICWQGRRGQIDAGRSFPLKQFQVLADVPGVRLISLHKGDGEAQLSDLPVGMTVETLGDDYDAGPDAFVDTAAIMTCCDLVITSDTAIAHLAGALGVKTWVAIKYVPEWRWMLDRDDSPWYPSMRLFRQTADRDWSNVFARIRDALVTEIRKVSPDKRAEDIVFDTPVVPISWGELIDKITILEIKSVRIVSQESRKKIADELSLLNEQAQTVLARRPAVLELKRQLSLVNQALWDIEERIRLKEKNAEFGAEFIELARSVYQTNDHRASLKKKINSCLNSRLTEEKSYLE